MRDEVRSYNTKIVEQVVANNKGLKAVRQQITRARRLMVAVRGEDGSIITDRDGIVERCAEYYRKLYSSTADRPDQTNSPDGEPIPDVLSSEVEKAVNQMKRNKAPGENGITIELIKEGGAETHKLVANLFTSCIRSNTQVFIFFLFSRSHILSMNLPLFSVPRHSHPRNSSTFPDFIFPSCLRSCSFSFAV
jgi:hypothetical protein